MKDALDRLGVLGLRISGWWVNRLSLDASLTVGRVLGRVVFRMMPRRFDVVADLRAALGFGIGSKEPWKILDRMGEHFGMMFVESLRIRNFNAEKMYEQVSIHGMDRWKSMLGENRPVVFMTGHLGNWELSQLVVGNLGRPIHVLAQPQKHPRMDAYLKNLRQVHGQTEAIAEGMGLRAFFRVLRRGQCVGLLGDRSAGKTGGVILPFFGRKTTFPTGGFELAARTGAAVAPAFMVRRKNSFYDFTFEETLTVTPDSESIAQAAQHYVELLEKRIREHPEQWLWLGKRWKYSWTKRLLILSDGKPGHYKQSEAVAEHFKKVTHQYGRPGMEYPTRKIEVRFLSKFHEKIFPMATLLMLGISKRRIHWLKWFLKSESWNELKEVSSDFILATGGALVPLQCVLSAAMRAKRVVMMKPPLPFSWLKFDLALVPAHDRGAVPRESLRPVLTPSTIQTGQLDRDREKLRSSIPDPARFKMAFFIGGPSRGYEVKIEEIKILASAIQAAGRRFGDYGLTTSRRTETEAVEVLKDQLMGDAGCQLFIDGLQDRRPEVAGGLMAWAEVLVVTEDSISMISEAVASGKKVIVLEFDHSKKLSDKHQRFKKILAGQKAILVSHPKDLADAVSRVLSFPRSELAVNESAMIQKRLQEIL